MFIKRQKFEEIKSHLDKKEITLIVGPRQVGKTTLMREIQKYLEEVGKPTLFLSLDFERDKIYFKDQESFIRKLKMEFGSKMGYVFIDEIQRKEDAGLFLKGIYDMDLGYKFIVSGSGSIELKEKIHESLAGRKRVFELYPVSFNEFLSFKTGYKYENRFNEFLSFEKEKIFSYFEEYINFGGYPRVVTEEKFSEKVKIIEEIYKSYLEKDISLLLKVEKSEAFSHLLKILASQLGGLTNYSEISNTLGIAVSTLKKYLWYAEKTFVINKITPFFTNAKKEIVKSPVYYFADLGLRNYILGSMGLVKTPVDIGPLFENFIFLVIKEKLEKTLYGLYSINYWRSKDGAEVDFVVNIGKFQGNIPIEVKFKDFKRPVVESSLASFINQYSPEKSLVINKNLSEKIKYKDTEIEFIPFNEFLRDDIDYLMPKVLEGIK